MARDKTVVLKMSVAPETVEVTFTNLTTITMTKDKVVEAISNLDKEVARVAEYNAKVDEKLVDAEANGDERMKESAKKVRDRQAAHRVVVLGNINRHRQTLVEALKAFDGSK